MARLTIEIDTGLLKKLPSHGNTRDRTLDELVNLVSEAKVRLKTMGASANGVVLYGENGPRGRITLKESDQRQGEARNWYDDTVHVGIPLSERRRLCLCGGDNPDCEKCCAERGLA